MSGIVLGDGSQDIVNDVHNQICMDFCSGNCEINLVGWSRGATIAMRVAELSNIEGCPCQAPVPINFIGLFDAVEMLPGDWTTTVPENVAHFAHAIKTNSVLIFPTTRFGRNEREFFLERPRRVYIENRNAESDGHFENSYLATHGEIGASRTATGAYNWIIEEARNSGVDI